MKRTDEEILKRIKEVADRDFGFFQRETLICFLSFEKAKPWLVEGVTADQWETPTQEVIVAELKGYMPFAWNKALNERGISSVRSVGHYISWLWLDGQDELVKFAEDDANYPMYGKPILKRICEHYGLEIPEGA